MRRIDYNIRLRRAQAAALNEDQVIIGNYKTRNFDAAPEALSLYSNFDKTKSAHLGELCAIDQDKLFDIYKKSKAESASTGVDINAAKELANSIMYLANRLGMKQEHSYIGKYVSEISKLLGKEPKEVDKSKAKEYPEMTRTIGDNFHASRSRKMEHKNKIIDEEKMYKTLGGTIRQILAESVHKKVIARKFRDKDGVLRTTREIEDNRKSNVKASVITEVKQIRDGEISGVSGTRRLSVPATNLPKAANDDKQAPRKESSFGSDHFDKWHKDRVVKADGKSVTATAAYENYCDHCSTHKKDPMAMTDFHHKLSDKGVQKARLAGRVRYIGIDLND